MRSLAIFEYPTKYLSFAESKLDALFRVLIIVRGISIEAPETPGMKRLFFIFSLLVFVLAGSIRAKAALIYDSGAPDLRSGYEMSNWIEADQFTLTIPTSVESVKFWDLEHIGFFQSTIPWAIYADSGSNTPGTLIASGISMNLSHLLTGRNDGFGFIEFVNTFNITPVSLPAGTYWLALHNGPLSFLIQQVYWETSATQSSIPSRSDIAPFLGIWQSNWINSKMAFQLSGTVITPATLVSVVSRKNHGTGVFEIPLPLAGNPGVECRSGGANGEHDVVFKFAAPFTQNATATWGGNPAIVSTAGNEVTVHCSGIANGQMVPVTLNSVAGNFSVQMGVLLGDTNGNHTVTSSDISQTKLQSGQAVTQSNYREDVTVNGVVNSTDISIVKSSSGTALP